VVRRSLVRRYGRCAVTTTVCIAVLLGFVAPRAHAVDTIFVGGAIVTMEGEDDVFEALAVTNGRITAIGAEAEIRQLGASGTDVVDLQGGALLPGLIEAHAHPLVTAVLGQMADVSGFTHGSRAAVMATLRAASEQTWVGDWILAYGWDPVAVPDLHPPTLAELDEIAPERPLLILTQMLHQAYINTAGYEAVGISKTTPPPGGGGEFQKDAAGELNGVLHEVGAIDAILGRLPKPPTGALELLLSLQHAKYAVAGYTTVGVLGARARNDNPIPLFASLAENAATPVRSMVYALPAQLDTTVAAAPAHRRFALKGVKLYVDGSPYTGGAAFADPYRDTPLTRERMGLLPGHRGHVMYERAALRDEVRRHHVAERQIAVHVQGEVAIDLTLDVFEEVLAEQPRDDHRHRLEHNALITDAQLARAKRLGLTPSFFIDHIYFYGTSLPDIVGPQRAARFMPLGSALRAGHRVSIHTDNPATPIGPFRALRTAVTRSTRGGDTVLGPEERVSIYEGLEALTIDAAWQMFEDEERGSLRAGKVADFVVLSRNPLDVRAEDLDAIEVVETWIDGARVRTSPWTWDNATLALRVAASMARSLLFGE